MHKMQIFLLSFLAVGVLAAPQRSSQRYSAPREAASTNNRQRFSNQFSVRDDDDSDEDFKVDSSRFSSGSRFSNARFSTNSDEIDQTSDEVVIHLSGGFNDGGFSNQGSTSRFSNQGSGFPNQGAGFSNQESGFSNQGSGFSNQGSGFSNQGSGFSNQGSGFSNQGSGFSNQGSGFSNQGSGFSNQGSGFSSQGSGFSNQESFSHQGSDFSNQGSSRFTNEDLSKFNDHNSGSFGPLVTILRDDRDGPLNGYYSFDFETSDGLKRTEEGSPDGPHGSVVQRGSWSFVYPDGTPAEFTFVADENGFQVDSDLIPTPHPLPEHAVAQIEKAERERAAGIIHDGSYREEDHYGSGGSFNSFRGNSDESNFDGFSGSSHSRDSDSFGDNFQSFQGHSGSDSDNSNSFGGSRSTSFDRNEGSFGGNSGGSSFGIPLPSFSGSSSNRRVSNQRQSNPRYGRSSNYYDFEDVLFESLKV